MSPIIADTSAFLPAWNAGGKETDQRLTVDSTTGGVQLTTFDVTTVSHVWITVETAQCRVTIDGSAPTSTNGHILNVGDWMVWPVALAHAAKFIRTGAASAVLHASPLIIVGSTAPSFGRV